MNESRFDMLVRSLAAGTSRRRLLGRTLLGLAMSTTLARIELHGAVAAKKGKKRRKVTLCQAGQTVTVAKKAGKRLLRQGATVGACQASSSPPSSPPPATPPPPLCTPEDCPEPGVCKVRACDGDVCAPLNAPNNTSCGSSGGRCVGGECCPERGVNCFGTCVVGCEGSLLGGCNDVCLVPGRQCCGGLFCQDTGATGFRCRPPA